MAVFSKDLGGIDPLATPMVPPKNQTFVMTNTDRQLIHQVVEFCNFTSRNHPGVPFLSCLEGAKLYPTFAQSPLKIYLLWCLVGPRQTHNQGERLFPRNF